MLVQILMEKTKMMPGRIMVLLVVSGVFGIPLAFMIRLQVGRGRATVPHQILGIRCGRPL